MPGRKAISRKDFGSMGESSAAEYLKELGFKILARNFRAGRIGEIDIVALEGGYLCIIEVKTRSSDIFGQPSEAVGRSKQQKLRVLADIYIARYMPSFSNVRFDVVEVKSDRRHVSSVNEINLIRNAF